MKALLVKFHQAFAARDYHKVIKCGEGIDLDDIHPSDERRRVIHRLAIAYQEIGASNSSLDLYQKLVRDYPDFQAGWEFFAQFFEKQKNYKFALAYWEKIADKFPESTLAYWSMGNIYKNNLKDYDKAIEVYQKQIDRFPERKSGYQGVVVVYLLQKKYDMAFDFLQNLSNEFFHYTLLANIYEDLMDFDNAILNLNKALDLLKLDESQIKETVLKIEGICKKNNKHKQLDSILSRYLDVYPQSFFLWKTWANSLVAVSKAEFDEKCDRFEKVYNKFPKNRKDIVNSYAHFLLATDKNDKALDILQNQVDIKKDFSLYQQLFVAFYQARNFKSLEILYQEVQLKFQNDKLNFWIKQLVDIDTHHNIDYIMEQYKDYAIRKYQSIIPSNYDFLYEKNIFEQLLGNKHSNVSKADIHTYVHTPKNIVPFDREKSVQKIIHSVENDVLFITFNSNALNPIQEHFKTFGTNDLDKVNFNYHFEWQNFAEKNKQYNHLLLKDNYISWYQLHTAEFLSELYSAIDELKPKKIICMGGSAGGFASLFFSNFIGADIVIAFNPQTFPFVTYTTPYQESLYINYFWKNIRCLDIQSIQRAYDGLKAKTYITLCHNESQDMLNTYLLDKNDKNLNIIFSSGNTHDSIGFLDKKSVFAEITKMIDGYTKNSSLQMDVFSNLASYLYSSKNMKHISKVSSDYLDIDANETLQELENKANQYMKNADYQMSIRLWQSIADRYPKSTLAYWSIGNIYKNNLKDYDKAIEMYQKQIERFPERQSGYQGVAESLQDAKRYDEALVAWDIVKKNFPKEPKSYWAIGHIYKNLQQFEQTETYFKLLIENFPQRESGYWSLAVLMFSTGRWVEAQYYWEQYFDKFVANEHAYLNYLEVCINLEEDNIELCEIIAAKLNQDARGILLKYVSFLKKYYKLSRLEQTSRLLLEQYPKEYKFFEWYFIALYCQSKWQLAKEAYLKLVSRFNINIGDITFSYLNVLWHLKEFDALESHYVEMVRKSYPQILDYFPSYDFLPERIAVAETIGDFERADKLRKQYQPPLERQNISKPIFDPKVECEYIHHSDANKVLLIFFSGLTFKIKKNFDKYGLDNLNDVKNDNKDIKSSFLRFAQRNTQYNMLMINDIYTSWEQMHLDEYLAYIKELIAKHKYQTVACIGVSSGGYAAMLYAQLLKVNLVFAFSPQTVPFFNYANYLAHIYKIQFSLGLREEDSILRLQNQQYFKAKTYIVVSKDNGMDNLSLNLLDKMDENLLITYCHGDEHVPIQGLGVKNVYSEICRVIDIMSSSNNQSTILLDIFSNCPTFYYNGYQYKSYVIQ